MTLKTIALFSILPIVALSWLGCGVDEEPIRPRAAAARGEDSGPDLEKMSVDERQQATEYQDEVVYEFFAWPEGRPGERDALADTRSCRQAALEQEAYVRSNGLVRFSIVSKCMAEQGWVVDKAAVRAYQASQ